jgi:hypothetical protein
MSTKILPSQQHALDRPLDFTQTILSSLVAFFQKSDYAEKNMPKTARPKRKASFHSINKIALLTQFDPIPPYNQPAKWVYKTF